GEPAYGVADRDRCAIEARISPAVSRVTTAVDPEAVVTTAVHSGAVGRISDAIDGISHAESAVSPAGVPIAHAESAPAESIRAIDRVVSPAGPVTGMAPAIAASPAATENARLGSRGERGQTAHEEADDEQNTVDASHGEVSSVNRR